MATALSTVPYCGQCGWTVGGAYPDIKDDLVCDACGSDLTLYGFASGPPVDPPPDNPPSPPNGTGQSGQVVFSWTPSPTSFPEGYDFRYSLDAGAYTTVNQATSPQVVPAAAGVEVCASLEGFRGGVGSGYSPDSCDTALVLVTVTGPPLTATKADLIEWLHTQDVHGVQASTKHELWDIIHELLD